MRRKSHLLAIGLTLILGGSAAVAPKISAQENFTDTAKRKVRTKVSPEYPALAQADERNRQGKNRSNNCGGRPRDRDTHCGWQPVACVIGNGSPKKMAV